MFVGATSGIGEGTAKAFAQAAKGGTRTEWLLTFEANFFVMHQAELILSFWVVLENVPNKSLHPSPKPRNPDTSSFNATSR